MDGLNLFAAVREARCLLGGRVEKVQQPDKEELILLMRSGGQNYRLLLCVSAERCGVQLTELKRENPVEAPMFCMLLRKHLGGAKLLCIEQKNADRVVHFVFEGRNEFGDPTELRLVAEIMGKYSNLILVSEEGRILEAMKRVGLGQSNVRTVLPGQAYEAPPSQDKEDPTQVPVSAFTEALLGAARPDKALSSRFFGLSPQMAGMLVSAMEGRPEAIHSFYRDLKEGRFSPHILLGEYGEPIGVCPFKPLGQASEEAESLHAAFDRYYSAHEVYTRSRQHSAQIRKVLQNNIARCEKKLALYAEAIEGVESLEKLRVFGDLLTANLYRLKGGAKEAAVENYYEPDCPTILIPMEPQLSVNANAQRYYKKYQKQKAGRDMALKQKEAVLLELAYLEGQLDNLEKCALDTELVEIREELKQEGYIRLEKGRKPKPPKSSSRPLRFVLKDGTEILVGKNNRQNDELTLKTAAPSDIWLHTKDIPGSHVIIRKAEPEKEALYAAAMLAAWYSRARGSGNVAVDYTPRKFVKKPAGAKPGMVIYTTNRTAYVSPEEGYIRRLERGEL